MANVTNKDLIQVLEQFNQFIVDALNMSGTGQATNLADIEQKLRDFSRALSNNFKDLSDTIKERDNFVWKDLTKKFANDMKSEVKKLTDMFSAQFHDAISTVIERQSTSGSIGQMGGSIAGSIVGTIFGGPAGMAIGSQLGSILGKAVGDATEGARMAGATIAPYMSGGLGMESFITGGGNKFADKDWAKVAREDYLPLLLQIRRETGMTTEAADKLQKAYGRMGVGAGSEEAVALAKLTSTYDQFFVMGSGETLKTQQTIIKQFGGGIEELIDVMGGFYDTFTRMDAEFKTHDTNIGRALRSGDAMADMLGIITTQARNAGASLQGVEEVFLNILSAVSGTSNKEGVGMGSPLGTPAHMREMTSNLAELVGSVTAPGHLSEGGAIKSRALYTQLQQGGNVGEELLSKYLETWNTINKTDIKPGTKEYNEFINFGLVLARRQTEQLDTSGKYTAAAQALDMRTRYEQANNESYRYGGSALLALQAGAGGVGLGKPNDQAALALKTTVESLKGPRAESVEELHKQITGPDVDRTAFLNAQKSQAERATAMFSAMDKLNNKLQEITNWTGTYFDELVTTGDALWKKHHPILNAAQEAWNDPDRAVEHIQTGMDSYRKNLEQDWIDRAARITPPIENPLSEGEPNFTSMTPNTGTGSEGGGITFGVSRSSVVTAEDHDVNEMERERVRGTNDGRR